MKQSLHGFTRYCKNMYKNQDKAYGFLKKKKIYQVSEANYFPAITSVSSETHSFANYCISHTKRSLTNVLLFSPVVVWNSHKGKKKGLRNASSHM